MYRTAAAYNFEVLQPASLLSGGSGDCDRNVVARREIPLPDSSVFTEEKRIVEVT
jgi:hypothetical protein